jgi:hypothetical protein
MVTRHVTIVHPTPNQKSLDSFSPIIGHLIQVSQAPLALEVEPANLNKH